MKLLHVKGIKIDWDPWLVVMLALMCMIGNLQNYLVFFAAIFLHELGHIGTAALLSSRITGLKILPAGLSAEMNIDSLDGRKRLLVLFSGPGVNLLLCGICLLLRPLDEDRAFFFFICNLYLAIFNLLPVIPLDGGRILREILSGRIGFSLSVRVTRRISILLAFGFIGGGIVQLYLTESNWSLFVVGIYILSALKLEGAEAAFMNLRNMIYRRTRLVRKGMYPARHLVAMKSMKLGELLKHMDFDRFHIVYVLDDGLKIAGVFTEQEILDALVSKEGEITFQQLLEMES